jgi:S-formylglutathione hydrolase FrmB
MSGKLKVCFALCFGVLLSAFVPGLASGQQHNHALQKTVKSTGELKDGSFRSASLQREMRYRVFLPQGYEQSVKRYPTLYLLHGLYGDFQNWSTLTNLTKWAEHLDLIIAMPDAGNSWYVNSATSETDKYEDYIVQDFLAEIDSHFRTIRDRHARSIAGLSMGGYAAMNFSLKHPELFSFSGVISGALDAPGNLDERKPEFRDGLLKVFGSHGNKTRIANDVFALLENADRATLPYFYIDCGADDMFIAVNRDLVSRLQQKKIAYEYHEFPGDHNWQYWDEAIRRFLLVLSRSRFLEFAR